MDASVVERLTERSSVWSARVIALKRILLITPGLKRLRAESLIRLRRELHCSNAESQIVADSNEWA